MIKVKLVIEEIHYVLLDNTYMSDLNDGVHVNVLCEKCGIMLDLHEDGHSWTQSIDLWESVQDKCGQL